MKTLSPLRSIKQYCKIDCCCNDMKSWKDCTRKACPLYSYRMGHRPTHTIQKHSSEQKQGSLLIDSDKKPIQETLI